MKLSKNIPFTSNVEGFRLLLQCNILKKADVKMAKVSIQNNKAKFVLWKFQKHEILKDYP